MKLNVLLKFSFLLLPTSVGFKWAGLSLIEEVSCTNQDSAACDRCIFFLRSQSENFECSVVSRIL